MSKPVFSIVLPLYNEEEVLPETVRRLRAVMESMGEPFEIVMVNDGSRDGTMRIAREICAADPRIKLIAFSRNFGHQTAITAGMDHAVGQAVVIIDADLQDPPEIIPEMAAKWREGNDVVYGRRLSRQGDSWFKRISARLYYRMLRGMTTVDIPVDAGDFRLIDAKVRDALLTVPEHNRYVRGLVAWLGFRQADVGFVREKRFAGTTKYPLRKMLRLAADGITSFSYKPLKAGISIGVALSVFALLLALFIFISRLFDWVFMEPGYASIMCVMLFFFGVVLVMLGVIGEYISRIFEEVKGRPLYIVSDKIGDLPERPRRL